MLRQLKQRFFPPLQPHRPAVPAEPSAEPELHGFVYCAALNVHRASDAARTPQELALLVGTLANMERLAEALHAPPHDASDILSWRRSLEQRLAGLLDATAARRDAA